jgi:glycine/serine hydroxymethyltransferase
MDSLYRHDAELAELLDAEVDQQRTTLAMVASTSMADPSVLAANGAAVSNVTAEGYPGARYHPGAARFDRIERLAVARARELFGARYANVQPHSCSSANLAVLAALVPPEQLALFARRYRRHIRIVRSICDARMSSHRRYLISRSNTTRKCLRGRRD